MESFEKKNKRVSLNKRVYWNLRQTEHDELGNKHRLHTFSLNKCEASSVINLSFKAHIKSKHVYSSGIDWQNLSLKQTMTLNMVINSFHVTSLCDAFILSTSYQKHELFLEEKI